MGKEFWVLDRILATICKRTSHILFLIFKIIITLLTKCEDYNFTNKITLYKGWKQCWKKLENSKQLELFTVSEI